MSLTHRSTGRLPDWLQRKLANPPAAGQGVNPWLYSIGRHLHAHMDPEAMFAQLRGAVQNCGRVVTDQEINRAIVRSKEVAWKPAGVRARAPSIPRDPAQPHERWPAIDEVSRASGIRDAAHSGVRGVADLWERSPVIMDGSITADDWLDWLFPAASFLCLAAGHPETARTRAPQKWTGGPADKCALVVPSPMTGPSGKRLDGRRSHRCLDNTGPRRWLVIEFDSGTRDDQAALHWHLRHKAQAEGWPRLSLVVSSGGKSLHGWYGICRDEDTSRKLMSYAVSLGADAATWNRCQPVRLPEGLRLSTAPTPAELPPGWVEADGMGGIRQTVLFWDPEFDRHTPAVPAPDDHADAQPCSLFLAASLDGPDWTRCAAEDAMARANAWREARGLPALPSIEVCGVLGYKDADPVAVAALARPGRRVRIFHDNDPAPDAGEAVAILCAAAFTAAGCVVDLMEAPDECRSLPAAIWRFPNEGEFFNDLFNNI